MDFFSLWLVLSFQWKIKNHLNFLSESELYFFIFCLFFTLQHKYGLNWQFLTLPLYYFTIDNKNKMAAATWMLVRASARATFIGSRGKISHLRTLPNALGTLRVSWPSPLLFSRSASPNLRVKFRCSCIRRQMPEESLNMNFKTNRDFLALRIPVIPKKWILLIPMMVKRFLFIESWIVTEMFLTNHTILR